MTFWIVLWKICFLVALALFAVMSVLVTVGGARDIRKLFQRLKEDREEE